MRILISAYTGLGNFILKTPMIRTIKDLWPDARIDLIGDGRFGSEDVLAGSNLIRDVYCLKRDASFWERTACFLSLRKNQYDAVLISFDACPFFLVLGSLLLGGKKIMHIDPRVNRSLRHKIKNVLYSVGLPGFRFLPVQQDRHEIDLNYDLLDAFYEKPVERSYQTFVSHKEDPAVLNRFGLTGQKYILFQPSAANGGPKAKTWAPENFLKLAQSIRKKYPGVKIVYIGDKGDLDAVQRSGLFDLEGVVNTMGQTTIAEVCALVRGAAVVVAHDSGIMHIADALGVNLIALYGPTDNNRTRPLGRNSRLVYSRNESFAAMRDPNVSEAELEKLYPDHYCLSDIKTEEVMACVIKVVSEKNNLI